jgi:competence protein ComEA
MSDPKPPQPPRGRFWPRHADQAVIAAIGAAALVMIGGYWLSQVVIRHRAIDIEGADPLFAAYRVDLNSADWPEFAQLPGIGETLARRIVEWRKAHGAFHSVDQLRQVSGIGAKRLDDIRPFLLLPEETESAGGQATKGAKPAKS